jgi:hypothetical protein
VNKLLTAIIAILMLAGSLCAISGAKAAPVHHAIAIVGEGSSPLPALLPSE